MKKILGIIFLIIIISVLGFLFFKFFLIRSVDCQSQYGECNPHLSSELLSIKNKNILETRNSIIKVLKNEPSIQSYSIRFELPAKFRVDVIERKAVAAFLTTQGDYALIDSVGDIVGKAKTTPLPKITSYYPLDRDQLIYIANLMSELYTFYGTSSGTLTADGLEIKQIQGKSVIFPLTGDKDVLLGSLSLILSRLPSVKEASTISVIDLRFKNPVLR